MSADSIVIVAAKRTPIGNFQGSLKEIPAPQLGSIAIKAALEQAQIPPADVDEVLMGCVLPAGLGQAPARQAALYAGLPVSTGCTTINKVCGSGMKSVMLARDILLTEEESIIVAGGMESMSNAPYLLPKARAGYRLGHHIVLDHMFYDGLEDAYEKGQAMGAFAENCAQEYNIPREEQDQFAIQSVERARCAAKEGQFKDEIVPITLKTKHGEVSIHEDEGPTTAKIEKIPLLKPAFRENGSITAANASSISDGAAALVLMTMSAAKKKGIKPLALIKGQCQFAQAPNLFTTAPIGAIEKLLKQVKWKASDVDLFEINEAFAVVSLVAMKELGIPHEKLNIHGGACVLGHPIGASGARILVTLLYALKQRNLRKGIASLCIGGGEATAVAIEIL